MALLVGRQAPSFRAKAVIAGGIEEQFSLERYLGKKYVLFFFYPKDFTFVCPTELIAFQNALDAFQKRDVAVVGCSTDTEYTHLAWVTMPRNTGGIQGVTYPLVADTNKTIAAAYDVLAGSYKMGPQGEWSADGECVAYRGLFLIDKKGIVQHQLVNAMPLGRSIDEALRMVDALQHFEKYGEVCPMNWTLGGEAFKPSHEATIAYIEKE